MEGLLPSVVDFPSIGGIPVMSWGNVAIFVNLPLPLAEEGWTSKMDLTRHIYFLGAHKPFNPLTFVCY